MIPEMTTFHTTECVYEVERDWLDRTRYIYELGDLRVLVEPYASAKDAPREIETALQRFRLTVPGYELVQRATTDRPVPDSLVIAHRLGGLSRFELSVFFRMGDLTWAFRAASPLDQEERCQEVLESFLASFQPLEES